MLDEVDRRILRLLQDDPSRGVPDLAQEMGQTTARLARRIERLRKDGVLLGSRAVIDWTALGYAVGVSLRITIDKTAARAFDEFLEAARRIPNVTELQTFLGRVDARLFLIAKDLPDYQRIYRDHILKLPHVSEIEALMNVARIHRADRMPL